MADVVVYQNPDDDMSNSWIRYFKRRIYVNNQNNLVVVIGKTGSGKTWSAISIAEMFSKETNVPFGIENIVFNLRDLMRLVNSGKLKKGSIIIFDEPQVTINSRDFMSQANKIFNYLLSTFRHRNFTLFFCTPYEDLLDKSARKMFHAKFQMKGINKNTKMARVQPKIIEYNSSISKFYEKYLRILYRANHKSKYSTLKLKIWSVPMPSNDLIKLYEEKKFAFTQKLNEEIEDKLIEWEEKRKPKNPNKLTEKQATVMQLMNEFDKSREKVALAMGITVGSLNQHIGLAKKKGITVDNYQMPNKMEDFE